MNEYENTPVIEYRRKRSKIKEVKDSVVPRVGKPKVENGTPYVFTFKCGQCQMQITITDYTYYDRICGRCNCKMAMTKVAK